MSKNKEPRFKEPLLGGREQLFSLRNVDGRRSELDISIIFSSYSPGEKVQRMQGSLIPSLAAVHNQLEVAFSLPVDDPSEPWNVAHNAISFSRLKEELLKQSDEVFVARPGCSRCMICRSPFDDYFQHIKSPAHVTAQNQNHATGYIKGLCGKFNQQKRNTFPEDHSAVSTERGDKSERTLLLEEMPEDLLRNDEE